MVFIGQLKQPVPPEQQAEITTLLWSHACVPVFFPASFTRDERDGYATSVLWPLLHNSIPDRHNGGRGGDGTVVSALFQAYEKVNAGFASVVREFLRPGDMVWVHNFQLMLLPAALKKERGAPHCTVSFFLHTPFPSPRSGACSPTGRNCCKGCSRRTRRGLPPLRVRSADPRPGPRPRPPPSVPRPTPHLPPPLPKGTRATS